MTLAFVPPASPASPLGRLDPRWRLAALAGSAAAFCVLGTLTAAAAAFAFALLLAALGRVPRRWFLGRLAALAAVLALFVLLLPFLLDGPGPRWQFGPVRVSLYGVRVAGLLCLKALTVVTLMLVLVVTAPLDATLKAAHSLRVPGLLIQMAVLTYRYLFLLADELARLLVALRVRGYRLRPRPQRLRMAGHLTGIVLVRGYERAERVGQAMRCRGFDGRYRSLTAFRTTWVDVAAFLLILGVAGGLLGWDFWQRYGGE
jgi:cobalt/nickel transport system permease protein